MNLSREDMMEQFLEAVRVFPFLYDKTHPEYKDKDAKMKRWAIIGRTFDLTGPQAEEKFRNVKDRWLKIVSAPEGARKSDAEGEAGKVHTEWTLFDIVDGMLRNTPLYAERSSTNVPPEEDICIRPSPLSPNSSSSPRMVARCVSSPAAMLFQQMYKGSPFYFTDKDDWSVPSASEAAASAAGPSGLSTSQARAAAPDPGSAKRRASNEPSSRTKRRRSDSYDEAVEDVLGSCSDPLLELKKK